MSTEPAVKLKRGYVREDGMVFLKYCRGKTFADGRPNVREVWLPREEFEVERRRLSEQASAYQRKQKELDSEGVREKQRMYVKLNRDAVNERSREWQRKNRPKMLKMISRWRAAAVKRDPFIRVLAAARVRLHGVLLGSPKALDTLGFLGVSTKEQYRAYVESLFEEGMHWGNYGQWEIDHIVPCYAFRPFTPERQRACFHHSNTRPMWKRAHRQKQCSVSDDMFDLTCSRAPAENVAVLRTVQVSWNAAALAKSGPPAQT